MRSREPAAIQGSGETSPIKRSRTAGSSWTTKGRIGSNGRPRAVARPYRAWPKPSCAGNLLAVHWASESLWPTRQGSGEVYPPAGLEMVARPNSRWPGAASSMWRPCLLESGPPRRCHPRRKYGLYGQDTLQARTSAGGSEPSDRPAHRRAGLSSMHRRSSASLSRTQSTGLTPSRTAARVLPSTAEPLIIAHILRYVNRPPPPHSWPSH